MNRPGGRGDAMNHGPDMSKLSDDHVRDYAERAEASLRAVEYERAVTRAAARKESKLEPKLDLHRRVKALENVRGFLRMVAWEYSSEADERGITWDRSKQYHYLALPPECGECGEPRS